MHKLLCRTKYATAYESAPEFADTLAALRHFTAKHRPTLCSAAYSALDINGNPDNARTSFFLVELNAREAKRAEQAFYVTGAGVVTYDTYRTFQPVAGLQMVLNRAHQEALHKEIGNDGASYAVLTTAVGRGSQQRMANIFGAGFGPDSDRDTVKEWRGWMR